MNNEQALAYARAHRDPTIGVLKASNHLTVPICRVVVLSVERREPFVNPAGPHERRRGCLDPSDEPLLVAGGDGLLSFPNDPNAAQQGNMVVTAFGCDRTDKHLGRYVVDENAVVFQRTLPMVDQGQVVFTN
jgi:hypothetical protein